MAVLLTLVTSSVFATTYDTNVQKVTDFNVSSGSCKGYIVITTTVSAKITTMDRTAYIIADTNNTTRFFYSYNINFSTKVVTNGQEVGHPVAPGQTFPLTRRGTIYFKPEISGTACTFYIDTETDK